MIGSSNNGKPDDVPFKAVQTRQRLGSRWIELLERHGLGVKRINEFEGNLDQHWESLFRILFTLYGGRYDFFYHVEQILEVATNAFAERPRDLQLADHHRVNDPSWFQSERMVGGALYVDLFSENLIQARQHIGYFKRLGLTYLHLMPLFAVRPGDNDGGYAISNYRSVDPRLGTMDDLRQLAKELREAGITLVLDFVFNHTADDHEWAQRAQAGERTFQDYYFLFANRDKPEQYEKTLREIFPTVRRGNFTWHEGMQKWVWTTFNSFQWDLNYSNPDVFRAMLEEMFFLANVGVDVIRLDAVAFIWKRLGTNCENLPEAHLVIQAFNHLARIATPGLLFKSEAIVHPDEVVKYIGVDECQISYNPTLMALLWESLATRKVELLIQTLQHRFQLPKNTTWVNYLRCHDDIGWTFDDEDASAIGINGFDHRQFLNQFYTGQFQGSFARGVPFQENLKTGDMRISGTMASLAGLEQAIEDDDEEKKQLAIRRMLLLHGVTLSIGGIPLLYLGEEWGMLNDYDFVRDPAKAGDTRWIHRPKMKWEYLDELEVRVETGKKSIRTQIFSSTQHLISLRKSLPAFAGQQMELLGTGNSHVLGYVRVREGNRVVVLANFSEEPQYINGNKLRTAGIGMFFRDVITEHEFVTSGAIELEPYQIVWLLRI